MHSSLRYGVATVLAFVLGETIARSQSFSGRIVGTVTDTSGAVRLSLQFRSEFFNHPNFSLPIVQFDSPRIFGALNQTPDVAAGNPRLGDGGPRVIQFGLKLIF